MSLSPCPHPGCSPSSLCAPTPATNLTSSPWFSLPLQDIRACTSTPCANNGTCLDLDDGQYECSCVPGFSGKDCQEMDGPCVVNG